MLIVEDHARLRAALRGFLQIAYPAFEIVEAADGLSALDLCSARLFRIVLLDIELPDISGLELITPIRVLQPRASIIVVSQHTAEDYAKRARAAGAFAYVTKDRLFRDLRPTLERALTPPA